MKYLHWIYQINYTQLIKSIILNKNRNDYTRLIMCIINSIKWVSWIKLI